MSDLCQCNGCNGAHSLEKRKEERGTQGRRKEEEGRGRRGARRWEGGQRKHVGGKRKQEKGGRKPQLHFLTITMSLTLVKGETKNQVSSKTMPHRSL